MQLRYPLLLLFAVLSSLVVNPAASSRADAARPVQSSTDSQRVHLRDAQGGPLGAFVPLADGTGLLAQDDRLLHVAVDQEGGRIIAEKELGYGTIVAMRQVGVQVVALTESHIVC
ncbi:MAG: hypothetical protein GYB68_13130 [Chloroflexi bacterium]|nr:hypothetical protein [Chloroflexota bacterium]